VSDNTKRHEKSAELIAASNAYYRRFANKIVELTDTDPTAEEHHLAELLLSGLTPRNRSEIVSILKKGTVRAEMLHRCLVETIKA